MSVAGRYAAAGFIVAALIAWAAQADAAEKLRVAKPTPTAYSFSLIDLGIEKGIFQKHGVEIELLTLAGGAKIAQAMVAGSIDIGFGSGLDFGYIARGATEKAVAAMAGPMLNIAITVRNDGSVPTVADLKGKRIGITTPGTITDWAARELSRRQGWGPEGMQIVPLGGPDGTIGALMAKNTEAVSGAVEGGLQLESQGRGKVLVNFGDTIKVFLTHAIYATNDLMAKRPDDLRAFLRGWFETVAYMRGNKDETVRITRQVTRLSPEVAERVYDIQRAMFSVDGRFDPEAVRVVKQALLDTGMSEKMPDDRMLFTEEFLPSR